MKISIVGAGNVGANCAWRLCQMNITEVVLVDIVEGIPQGKALDMGQSAQIIGFDAHITGTNNYSDSSGSDIVVVTAGVARKPGMSRDELLSINARVVNEVINNVVQHSPDSILIIVTNPVDAMTYLAVKASGFDRRRIIGLSGVLDGARLASFIAQELDIDPTEINPCVIGQHGQQMVVIPRLTMVKGRPLVEIISKRKITSIIQRTINAGTEIVSYFKSGSAFYAPGAAAAHMAYSVAADIGNVLPCATYLKGEYGLDNVALGVPVRLGHQGILDIIELDLSQEESEAMNMAAKAVKQTIGQLAL
jgi:malate dehydrogenase